MLGPPAGRGGESAGCGERAGCSGRAASGGARVRSRPDAGGTACGEAGGSGGGGGKAGGSAGPGSTGGVGRVAGPAPCVPPGPCGAGWLGAACAILGWGGQAAAEGSGSETRASLACCRTATQGWTLMLSWGWRDCRGRSPHVLL